MIGDRQHVTTDTARLHCVGTASASTSILPRYRRGGDVRLDTGRPVIRVASRSGPDVRPSGYH
jgi:hypothetical protein